MPTNDSIGQIGKKTFFPLYGPVYSPISIDTLNNMTRTNLNARRIAFGNQVAFPALTF